MIEIDIRKIHEFEDLISQAENIVITTHQRPDGDGLGSSLGIYHFLNSIHKKANLVLPDKYADSLEFMFNNFPKNRLVIYTEDAESSENLLRKADLIFCMDFNDFHRTDMLEPFLLQSKAKKILIDHHPNPEEKLFDLIFSKIEISSASELLFYILMYTSSIEKNVQELPLDCGTALMIGMTADTNNFANSVYPSTFIMASALLELGVDRDKIINELYLNQSENRIRLMAHLLDTLKITSEGVAYMILDKKTIDKYKIEEGETEGFVNIPLGISQVRMSIFAKEEDDSVRISLRSKEGVSVNTCSGLYFNGGGHELAAGGKLIFGKEIESVDDVGTYIEKFTTKFMKFL